MSLEYYILGGLTIFLSLTIGCLWKGNLSFKALSAFVITGLLWPGVVIVTFIIGGAAFEDTSLE